jgi:hypothetical protein
VDLADAAGARHDLAAAREHGIIDALANAGVEAVVDTANQGARPSVAVPQRRRRLDPTPAATDPYPPTRKTSTPRTLVNAVRASGSTPS